MRLNILNAKHQKDRLTQKLQKKLNELKQKRKKQKAKLDKIAQNKQVAKAFVTFQSQKTQRQALKSFDKSKCRRCLMIAFCQRKRIADYYFRNQWLHIKQAPQPSVILWENLSVTKLSRCCRRIFSFLVATILILVSFSFILVAKYYQNQSIGSQFNCSSKNVIDQQAATKDFELGDNATGLYKCFCMNQFFDSPSTTPKQEMCKEWLSSWLEAQSWSIGSIAAIALVNVVLVIILRLLSRFQRKHSQNSQLTSSSLKIFVAIFFNSGLVLLLANANIHIQPIRETDWFPVFAGEYDDFQVGWYQKVGSSIILTMLINLVTPHMYGISQCFLFGLKRCCDRSCRCHRRHTKQLIQQDYQKLYLGPDFLLEYRYSQILNILYISFMYSSGMPVLYFLGALWYTITFFIDKCLYLRLYRKLPHFDRMVHSRIRSFFDFAIFLHMAIGFWMYSNTQIFLSDMETSALNQHITGNIPFFDPQRFSSLHSIFMILAFAGVIVFYILRKFCLQKCLKCCWKSKNNLSQREKQTKTYYQVLDISHLLERQKQLIQTQQQVDQQANYISEDTKIITNRERGQIAKNIQIKIDQIDQNYGSVVKKQGKVDRKKVQDFININKSKLPKMKINGLSSYVMTQNPTYADMIGYSFRKNTVKKKRVNQQSIEIFDERQIQPQENQQ